MHAITISEPGGPDVLTWTEVPDPVPGQGEVLIDVAASAVNRADVLQRQGNYPVPSGASPYPGLECSGRISALGAGDTGGWQVGDEVCALLSGGGYAEKVAVPAATVLPVPAGVDLVSAAGLPEVACTVWSNVLAPLPIGRGRLAPGETLLVHGGSSGIGTMAIQLGVHYGSTVIVTAGSAEKVARCVELGAAGIDYRTEDFVARVRELTDGRGVDVILDIMGAAYLGKNVDLLAVSGRLVIIGMQGGVKGELNLGALLGKRASISGTALRSRAIDGPEGKAAIVAGVRQDVWPAIENGAVRPIIDRALPMADAAEAHRLMESSAHIGKILLVT